MLAYEALSDLDIFVRTVDNGNLAAAVRTRPDACCGQRSAKSAIERVGRTTLLARSIRRRLTSYGELFLE